jgi:hypothetical protein
MMPDLHKLTPEFRKALERKASVMVASHPYFHPMLEGMGLPICYQVQDFELHMKTALFENLSQGQDLTQDYDWGAIGRYIKPRLLEIADRDRTAEVIP